jgi:8-oxo-dGTP diphosphatase
MGLDARPTNLRCSALVLRGDAVLLCQRITDWVLPGGTPQPGESIAACVRREVREETALTVTPDDVAFVLDIANGDTDHLVEIVFHALEEGEPGTPRGVEDGLVPRFVPLDHLPRIGLRPPIGGHIRAFRGRGAPYLGNVWRPAEGTARRAW